MELQPILDKLAKKGSWLEAKDAITRWQIMLDQINNDGPPCTG